MKQEAIVTLVAGPTTLEDPDIEVVHVQSAEEMFEQVTSRFDETRYCCKSSSRI